MFNDQQLKDWMENFGGYGSPLKDWMENFGGYGSPQGRYALVGIEEGGGGSEEDVQARLDTWVALGQPQFADLAAFHTHSFMNNAARLQPRDMPKRFFQQPIKDQNTWRPLIRLVLSAEGDEPSDPSLERVKNYQARDLGRLDKKTLLTELLPLPSPGRKKPFDLHQWLYGNLSNLPYLKTRGLYEPAVAQWRTHYLKTLVVQHRPPAVVFYSSDADFQHSWQEIAGVPYSTVSASGIDVAYHKGTVFMIIDHSVSFGSHDYFLEAGRILALEMERIKTQSTPYVYSTRPLNTGRDRSLYRRFWRQFLPANATMPIPFVPLATSEPAPSAFVSIPYSTQNLPTSFLYGLSIAGRWAVSQFNVPLTASSATEAQALRGLAMILRNLPIYAPIGPFIADEDNNVLYIKWLYRDDVVDTTDWPALQRNMLTGMRTLFTAFAPFI